MTRKSIILVAGLLLSGMAHAKGQELLRFNYVLFANTNYTTNLNEINQRSMGIDKVQLFQSGPACEITIQQVVYTTEFGGRYYQAESLGQGVYGLPQGRLSEIAINFRQGFAAGNCSLIVNSVDETDPEPEDPEEEWEDWDFFTEFDVEAIWGAQVKVVGPFDINAKIEGFRLDVPRACGDISLRSALVKYAGERTTIEGSEFRLVRNEDYKTLTYRFSRATDVDNIRLKIRGKRRDCQVSLEVLYY